MGLVTRYGFLAAFFTLCVLPLVGMVAGLSLVKPVDENRALAPLPAWTWPPDLTKFSQQADRWFGDHFGFRSFLIRLKTQIDLTVFRTSNRVHVGSDGWLFYRSVMDLEKPSVDDLLSKSEPDVLAGIAAFSAALHEKGIRLLIAPNLLADRFVPDRLPSSVPRLPSPPRFDHFLHELAALPNLTFIDTPAIVRRVERERLPFHKTDFHWNDPAAFEVARDLVEQMARMEGRTEPLWTHKLEIETRRQSGGIAMFMPVFFPPVENALFVKPTWTYPAGFTPQTNQGPFEYTVSVKTPDPKLLPPVFIVGDSFFDGILRSGFDTYFRELYRMRWKYDLKVSGIAAAIPPDTKYVVVQFIEVSRITLLDFADQADVALAVDRIRKLPARPENAQQ